MSPVEARPAVSVIPVRDGSSGIEVFVQHRQSTMDFAPGAVVFPGGRTDPEDVVAGASLPAAVVADHLLGWAVLDDGLPDPEALARTRIATAVRELAEETGLVADPADLHPWDSWVTPEASPKRFDVAFFVLPVPADARSQPRHRTSEARISRWEPAAQVLDDDVAGRALLLTPTRVLLTELVALHSVPVVLAHRPLITGVREDRAEGRPRPSR